MVKHLTPAQQRLLEAAADTGSIRIRGCKQARTAISLIDIKCLATTPGRPSIYRITDLGYRRIGLTPPRKH